MEVSDKTRLFTAIDKEAINTREILAKVWAALEEKGYEPLDQIVGYLVSGDPSYITAHDDARRLIQKLERNDLLEEIVADYFKGLV
ncbi:MAG TPA: IreB family regulatory phosphoprotein [Firmicutes bacterium]|nr:IreB family regulatory phosphoprotein [Bacillota bacterium]HHT43206.1 IreB family regulatory phosphoprotein [Bacillota bacterium]